jgi:hypothetical protein
MSGKAHLSLRNANSASLVHFHLVFKFSFDFMQPPISLGFSSFLGSLDISSSVSGSVTFCIFPYEFLVEVGESLKHLHVSN